MCCVRNVNKIYNGGVTMAVSQANFFPELYILYWNDCNGKAKSDFLGKKVWSQNTFWVSLPFFHSSCRSALHKVKNFKLVSTLRQNQRLIKDNLDFSIFTVRFWHLHSYFNCAVFLLLLIYMSFWVAAMLFVVFDFISTPISRFCVSDICRSFSFLTNLLTET